MSVCDFPLPWPPNRSSQARYLLENIIWYYWSTHSCAFGSAHNWKHESVRPAECFCTLSLYNKYPTNSCQLKTLLTFKKIIGQGNLGNTSEINEALSFNLFYWFSTWWLNFFINRVNIFKEKQYIRTYSKVYFFLMPLYILLETRFFHFILTFNWSYILL